ELSVDNMGIYLKAGENERKKLATSLRNAAKAYETVDENAAESMLNTMGGSGSSKGGAEDSDGDASPGGKPLGMEWTAGDIDFGGIGKKKHHDKKDHKGTPDDYQDLLTKTELIEQIHKEKQAGIPWKVDTGVPLADQVKPFNDFADEWSKYYKILIDTTDPNVGLYRPFQYWKSEAATTAEKDLRDMRDWVQKRANECQDMSTQARDITTAHRICRSEHPTYQQVKTLEDQFNTAHTSKDENKLMSQYNTYQQQSKDALNKYASSLGISAQSPTEPPSTNVIDPPTPTPPAPPTPPTPFDPDISDFTGPSTPVTPGGSMSQADAPGDGDFNDELMDGSVVSAGGGMRPASFSGGGPKTPLKPAAEREGGARLAPRDAGAGLGQRGAGVGGAMGGGGMGAAPAGHGSGKDGKVKHTDDEESLYNEERQWTEGVIGAHRRKDPAEMMADRNES
ncbi:MAG: hypothetical protein K2Q25_10390, partial [Mycobacteriaceae bacterium]|nr:hypothetical protein [Mycobacteriaceae bacterium]